MSSAAMVSRADARLGERHVLGDRRVEVVAHHQHVEVLVDRVHRVGHASGWSTTAARSARRRRWMMSGAWPPPAPSVWIGVDGAALDRRRSSSRRSPTRSACRCGSRPARPCSLGDAAGSVDRRGRRAPVLVQLEADGAGLDLLDAAARRRLALPLPRKPRFIGNASAASSIRMDVPGPGVHVVAERAGRRARAAADHRGDARHQRFVDLLRADEVDVRIDAARA